MDVDPVVGKELGAIDDQNHRQKVAEAEPRGVGEDLRFLASLNALMTTRTSQGAVAWIVELVEPEEVVVREAREQVEPWSLAAVAS
jgi:hypothetical protein